MKKFLVDSKAHGHTKTIVFETLDEAKIYADKMQKKRKRSISVYKVDRIEDYGRNKWAICGEVYNTKGEYRGYNADGTPATDPCIRIWVEDI